MSDLPPSNPPPPDARPPWRQVHLWQIAVMRDLFWITVALFLLWFGYQLRAIFTPVLIALVLAYLFHPLITRAEERYGMKRMTTVSIILAVLVMVFIGMLAWLGPGLIAQTIQLARDMPDYVRNLSARFDVPLGDFGQTIDTWRDNIREDPVGYLVGIGQAILAGTGGAMEVVGTVMGAAAYLSITLLLIPIYFFFFAWQFPSILHFFKPFLPVSQRPETLRIIGKMDGAVSGFFRDRVLIAMMMAVLFTAGWSPLLADVPYWLLLGPFTGLLSLIPFAGGLGWALALALKSLELLGGAETTAWEWVWGLGGLSVVFGVVQAIEGWLLTPWIQGRSLNMSSATIILVVLVGGATGGTFGLILCIPLAACAKILLHEAILPRLRRWAAAN